jgi:hypothetical protein
MSTYKSFPVLICFSILSVGLLSCDRNPPGMTFSKEKSDGMMRKLPDHDPSHNVAAVECWQFNDSSKDDFTTYGNLAVKAHLVRRLSDVEAARFTHNLWQVILNRTERHLYSGGERSKAFAVLIFYTDGEVATVIIRHVTDASSKLVAGDAEIGESQLQIDPVQALQGVLSTENLPHAKE